MICWLAAVAVVVVVAAVAVAATEEMKPVEVVGACLQDEGVVENL